MEWLWQIFRYKATPPNLKQYISLYKHYGVFKDYTLWKMYLTMPWYMCRLRYLFLHSSIHGKNGNDISEQRMAHIRPGNHNAPCDLCLQKSRTLSLMTKYVGETRTYSYIYSSRFPSCFYVSAKTIRIRIGIDCSLPCPCRPLCWLSRYMLVSTNSTHVFV